MKNLMYLLFICALTNIVSAQGLKDLLTTNFVSLTVPIDYQGGIKYLNDKDIIEDKLSGEVKHDKTYLASFPNLVSSVTTYEADKNGGLTLLGNSLSTKNTSYVVIYDYAQTQTIKLEDNENNSYYGLVGISVRMVARIKTKTSGINLSDIYGLGVSASNKKVQGSLEVRANGINSLQINSLIPVTADISPSSIANALQAVATIKSHIYDIETKITPQFLAFNVVVDKEKNEKSGFKGISEKLNEFSLKGLK